MNTLAAEQAKQLAIDLRNLYAFWEKNPNDEAFGCGICYALKIVTGTAFAYQVMDVLLRLTECNFVGGYLFESGWADRATMCLFLAEWLESDFEGQTC